MDLQANSDKTPFIADLKPSGKYVMADVHKVRPCSFDGCMLIVFGPAVQLVKQAIALCLTTERLYRWAASRQS